MSGGTLRRATLILAGGDGRRIGGDKPLRLLQHATLVARACRHGRRERGALAVSVRYPGQAGALALPEIQDDPEIGGPLAGLLPGLRWAAAGGAEALLTLPCDMPFLPDDLGARLERHLPGRRVAIARSGGRLHPVCALWRIETLDLASDYLASGRRSLKGLAEHVGLVAVDWPAAPRDPFFNVNDAADLAAADALLRESPDSSGADPAPD